jgi:hypothetical protein
MGPQARPRRAGWAARPAGRRTPGHRPPVGALLALACRAMLWGYRRATALAAGGR